VLNFVGSRIFELSDGTHTIAEIAETISSEYDVTVEEATEDVAAFIRQMEKRKVLILNEMKEN
jgi:hypothetical protein